MKEKLLEELIKTLQDGKAFVITQAPEVVQEYLNLLFIENLSCLIFSVLIAVVLYLYLKNFIFL